ncbi:hypothetical protein Golob_028009, partial [Gossypium lobatum]|nr:hypothetical protein [Gossypium lobatum]
KLQLVSITIDEVKILEKQEKPTSSSAGAVNFDARTTVMCDVKLARNL